MSYVDEFLKELGIKDYDELKPAEREEYHKMLDIESSAQMTLDDFKRHIKAMRQAVEWTLASEKLSHDEDLMLKARLKNYILFESFFERPERAKAMLEQYRNRVKR